jgi:pyridoxamine 5'-phosphate oxidase
MDGSREIEDDDPIELYDAWLKEAEAQEPNDPTAAALATATAAGVPSARMVLVKRIDERRFCFFTNAESRKGRELAENPRAALCFHWKSLRRQVRVEGAVLALGDGDTDAYFHSRPRGSQIGAAASDQSRVLASRAELEERARRFADAHPGQIPRPDFWRGFFIEPERIEFWISGRDRLHDRFLFTHDGRVWRKERLYP